VADHLAVLCGGLGGSRLVHSLALAAGADRVAAIGNVGDDLEFLGLHVSPDLDTVLYTLAGLLDEERGWGVRDETYGALGLAERLGEKAWFTLGDRDIGLHLARTRRLRAGEPLSAVTAALCESLGIAVRLLPVTDDPVRTFVEIEGGELDFQSWFVGRRHADPVRGVRYDGAEAARPAPGVVDGLEHARAVIVAPSNPFVSIGPILAVPGIREAIGACPGPVAAVSPIVGGRAIRGPLVGMLETLGHEASAVGVARLYSGLIDTFVLDVADAALVAQVEELGLRPIVCGTIMVNPGHREEVGRQLLEALVQR
jgi:LPPG:FO 2-phospho-L-lactate transferase